MCQAVSGGRLNYVKEHLDNGVNVNGKGRVSLNVFMLNVCVVVVMYSDYIRRYIHAYIHAYIHTYIHTYILLAIIHKYIIIVQVLGILSLFCDCRRIAVDDLPCFNAFISVILEQS